jgi:rhodanese-related sulfurtransferase
MTGILQEASVLWAKMPLSGLRPFNGPVYSHIIDEASLKGFGLNLKRSFSSLSAVPWKQSFREAWNLFVFASFFAVLFNAFYSDGIPLKTELPKNYDFHELLNKNSKSSGYAGWKTSSSKSIQTSTTPKPLNLDQILRVNLVGAKSRFDQKNSVFLDARSPEEYAEGHIPGALEFYADDFEKFAPLVLPQLKDKNQELIAYCHGSTCELSLHLANALMAQGYTNVKVFFGGWPEWKKANYPINTGDQP